MNFKGSFFVDRESLLRQYRDAGLKTVGHICASTPDEIFRANGFVPIRITPRYTGDYSRVERYLPACVCSHARCMLSELLQGRYDAFDAFFFSSNCTTIRCLQNHFCQRSPDKVISDFIVPTKSFDSQAEEHLRRELARLDRTLQAMPGRRQSTPLTQVIATYRENRRLMGEVSRLRRERPNLLSVELMNELSEYNNWVDKETANPRIAAFIEQIIEGTKTNLGAPTVFVLGNCCGNSAILDLIDRRGCKIVGDLLSTGEMTHLDVPECQDPYESIASRLNNCVPCPAKIVEGAAYETMMQSTLDRVRSSGASAVVLVRQKFCDPHALERPFLLPRLRELGLPLLEIETEADIGNIEQIHTRIDAFLEMFS